MTRSFITFTFATLLAGCIQAPTTKTQDGPTITVTLDPDSGFDATSNEPNPYLSLPTNATQYSFKLIVETNKGRAYDGDSYTYPNVTMAQATLTLAGANIPALSLTVDSSSGESTYTSQGITVPSSFKNQSMMVHADAEDASGLSSNILDFMCALR